MMSSKLYQIIMIVSNLEIAIDDTPDIKEDLSRW
jgi:hypothetical protein